MEREVVKKKFYEILDLIEALVEKADPDVRDKMRHDMYMHLHRGLSDSYTTVFDYYVEPANKDHV